MNGEHRHHAVVVGASVGGLAAARVLADHFDTVTVLDRDALHRREPRKTVPQGRHAHALLGGGRDASSLSPRDHGRADRRRRRHPRFQRGSLVPGGRLPDAEPGRPIRRQASRPFVEEHMRRRTRALANVTIETGVTVDGLVARGRSRARRAPDRQTTTRVPSTPISSSTARDARRTPVSGWQTSATPRRRCSRCTATCATRR